MQKEIQFYSVFERIRYSEGETALSFRVQGNLQELRIPLQPKENPHLEEIAKAIDAGKQVKFSGKQIEFPAPPIGYAIAIGNRLFSFSRKPIFRETLERWAMHIYRGEISLGFDKKYKLELIEGPWDTRIQLERIR